MSALRDPRTLALLRRLLWGVAVVCLGTWGWARLDAAHFQAAADRRLDGALAASAAAIEAQELEAAVARELDGPRPAAAGTDEAPEAAAADRTARAASSTTAARAASPTVATVGATEVLGRLRIPRIGLSVVVAEGIDRRTLRRAAGRIPGTAPLGGDGNVGIAGHRDGVFRDLERAAAGDVLLLETPRGTERYEVEAVRIVHPGATEVLADDGRARLTLVTCYPFDRLGPAPERWIVRARLVG
jgi:sortase A